MAAYNVDVKVDMDVNAATMRFNGCGLMMMEHDWLRLGGGFVSVCSG